MPYLQYTWVKVLHEDKFFIYFFKTSGRLFVYSAPCWTAADIHQQEGLFPVSCTDFGSDRARLISAKVSFATTSDQQLSLI